LTYIRVYVTRHALERLWERKARGYRKFNGRVVADIISNIIRSGYIIEWRGGLRVSTSSYTLACTLHEGILVVKTVMKTSELSEAYRSALRRARKSKLKPIVVNVEQLDRWCRSLGKVRWCEVCGATRDIETLAYCKLHKITACSYCCPTLGGPYSAECKSCKLGQQYWTTPRGYREKAPLAKLMST